jgi:hypothetical protein
MRSRHHFPISLAVGLAAVATVPTPLPALAVVVGAGLLGTFVDLDHFLIARVRTGSWDPLRRCLADPRMALLEQDDIFEAGDVGSLARLVTHGLLTVGVVAGLWAVDPALALVAGVVLAVHIGCDVAWELARTT